MHNIEFHTPVGKLSETMINTLRDDLVKLFHLYTPLRRADVLVREDETLLPEENKVCEIRLFAYGEDLVAHSRMKTFEEAIKKTMKELKRMVRQKAKTGNQVPDKTTSSVKV
jgi:ribosome-associated translation inhibitor RaiA